MSEVDNNKINKQYNDDLGFCTDYAIAISYEKDKNAAPKVLAKGEGHIAEKIIQIALDKGIEIHQDADLLQILKAVDIDEEIPVEAFTAVAEIISFIYKQNNKKL